MTSSNWTIAKVFLSVCTCYGKKAAKRFWKLLNIVLKLRSCVRDVVADGSGWGILLWPATNKWTYGKHWRLSVGVSMVLDHTKRAVRARVYFPIVNRSWMVSLSRADKKSVKDIIVIKTKMSPNILGRLLIYIFSRVYVWETQDVEHQSHLVHRLYILVQIS